MKIKKTKSGQVIVEYILLMFVAISVAMVGITQLIKRDSDATQSNPSGGIIIKKWIQILDVIGTDESEKSN